MALEDGPDDSHSVKFPTTDTGIAAYLKFKGFTLIEVVPDIRQCTLVFGADDYKQIEEAIEEFRNRTGDARIARGMLNAYQDVIQDINIGKQTARFR